MHLIGLTDRLLPGLPDMEQLRELVIDPEARATTQVGETGRKASA
jgi:hypothetical protein